MGLPHIFIRFINNFLSDRFVYFTLKGLSSPLIKLNYAVPQGSPILHVNDIPIPNTAKTTLSQFADKVMIFDSAKNIKTVQEKLQTSLNNIMNYFWKKRISVNLTKSFTLYFPAKTIKGNHTLSPQIFCPLLQTTRENPRNTIWPQNELSAPYITLSRNSTITLIQTQNNILTKIWAIYMPYEQNLQCSGSLTFQIWQPCPYSYN